MSIVIRPPKFLFPAKVQITQDTEYHTYGEEMIQWMIDYSYKHETFNRSNAGGYQSPDSFYLEESFGQYLNRLSEIITASVDEYCHGLLCEKYEITLSNMWFNLNRKGNYNLEHTHPGCLLAGVFYLSVPKKAGPIVFFDPSSHSSSEIDENCIEEYVPQPGEMLLFPAYLPHRVDPNLDDDQRVSLSFNLVAK